MSFADKTSANACYNMNVDKKVIGDKEEVTQTGPRITMLP